MTGDLGNAGTLSQNERFLKLIFGTDWERAHVCAVGGDPSKKESGPWGGGWAGHRLKSIGDKTNNYFAVSLFKNEQRRLNTFEKLICIPVDDVGPKLEPELVELLLGPPTWIIETSPDNFQWGYKLVEPLTDAADPGRLIKAIRVALTGQGGKDPGMEAINRYVRLPTGLNLKKTLGKPWSVRLVKLDLSIGLKANVVGKLLGVVGQGDKGQTDDDAFGLAPCSSDKAALRPSSLSKSNTLRGNINADDSILKSLRKLGLVLGQPRETAMGWGFDIRCPWVDEHTDRAETGTVYVAGAGKFKCQHGHCADRTVEDVRGRLDTMLKDNGHSGGLVAEEFDEIDPASVPEPPQGLKPARGTNEIRFFDRFVTLRGRNLYYDLDHSSETTAADIDARWSRRLVNALPRIKTGKVEKPIAPSKWLREQGVMVNGLIGWPGMPRVTPADPKAPGTLYVNTWKAMDRPLRDAPDADVNARAIMPWLNVFWHVVGWETDAERQTGETLLDWKALALGDQRLKPGWHVIIMGQQGVGKDSIMLPIAATLGPHWAQNIESQQIGADFNEWAGKRLVQFTETNSNTRGSMTAHDVMTILKALFDNTRGWVTINPKFMSKYTSRNVVMGWFTSNEREPLRLEPGDRRFLVLDRNETKPLSPKTYADLHAWLTTPTSSSAGVPVTGIERVAEFLYRRWDSMPEARRKVLFGTAPMTLAKQALLSRLKHPLQDWMERCIALDPSDPLTFPDIVTVGYVHSRLFTAIKTGGEGLPGGTNLPGLPYTTVHLKAAGAVVLHDGKQIKVKGSPVVLWAVRNASAYLPLDPVALAKIFVAAVGGTSAGLIN